jgi:hypothetical protein
MRARGPRTCSPKPQDLPFVRENSGRRTQPCTLGVRLTNITQCGPVCAYYIYQQPTKLTLAQNLPWQHRAPGRPGLRDPVSQNIYSSHATRVTTVQRGGQGPLLPSGLATLGLGHTAETEDRASLPEGAKATPTDRARLKATPTDRNESDTYRQK